MTKIALVTGGSRGIGFGIAEKLADEKWDLLINGVRLEGEVADALAALRSRGIRVGYARGDIGSAEGRNQIVNTVREFCGDQGLNLLVNNAGVAPRVRADLLETTEESFDYVLGTNLKGAFFLTQAIARDMVARKKTSSEFRAAIVNITSISAELASINRGEYCIAKAGLSMLSKVFAARLGSEEIPVYEVQPGIIRTDMTANVTAKYDQLINNGLTIQRRWGMPDDVGRVVASLARGDFAYSTGSVFMVDGGLTVPRL